MSLSIVVQFTLIGRAEQRIPRYITISRWICILHKSVRVRRRILKNYLDSSPLIYIGLLPGLSHVRYNEPTSNRSVKRVCL